MQLNRAQLSFFEENGYVVIDDFFTRQECDEFAESTRQVIRSFIRRAQRSGAEIEVPEGEEFDLGTQLLNDINHDYVAQIYDTICFTPAFYRLAGKRETSHIVNQLMGRPPEAAIFGFKNRCRVDPPEDARRLGGWHQQVFAGLPKAGPFIQTWAPMIHDNTVENGTLKVAAGSHKIGVPRSHWIEGSADKVVQIVVDDSVVEKFPRLDMNTKLGQLLVFTGTTIHCSGTNTSKLTRYSLIGEYYDVDDPEFSAPKPGKTFRNMSARAFYDSFLNQWS
jgi:ectoine hydroxylase-related dioxygenase (phytanoyl-CoA dioxygenase family)